MIGLIQRVVQAAPFIQDAFANVAEPGGMEDLLQRIIDLQEAGIVEAPEARTLSDYIRTCSSFRTSYRRYICNVYK